GKTPDQHAVDSNGCNTGCGRKIDLLGSCKSFHCARGLDVERNHKSHRSIGPQLVKHAGACTPTRKSLRRSSVAPEWSNWTVRLRLAVARAWPAELVGVAQPATRRMQARTPLVLVAYIRSRRGA